ncbi:MAG: hypothetical protein ACLT1J_10405 [Mediterraneibacter gnavus]
MDVAWWHFCRRKGRSILRSWDDSLVTDKKYETEQLRADFSMGVVGPVEYRMKRFGETEEQAIKMLKQASQFSLEDTME